MLTPPSRDGIEAYVRRVGGQRFREHEIVQRREMGNKPATTYGYLESEEGVEFELGVLFHDHAKLRYQDHDWNIRVSVDGRLICDRVNGRDQTFTLTTMIFEESGVPLKGNLRFSTLRTTDNDDEVTLEQEDLLVIGDIQIDMYRGHIGKQKQCCGCNSRKTSLPKLDLGVAHEKDKKWSGAVGVGQTVPAEMSGWRTVGWQEIDRDKPYHRFIFKYRTTAVLQLLKVIGVPRSLLSGSSGLASTPSPAKRKREIIHIDVSESEGEDTIVTPTKSQKWSSSAATKADVESKVKEEIKPNVRDVKPDIKPLMSSMARMSLGGRSKKRAKTPIVFRFKP